MRGAFGRLGIEGPEFTEGVGHSAGWGGIRRRGARASAGTHPARSHRRCFAAGPRRLSAGMAQDRAVGSPAEPRFGANAGAQMSSDQPRACLQHGAAGSVASFWGEARGRAAL